MQKTSGKITLKELSIWSRTTQNPKISRERFSQFDQLQEDSAVYEMIQLPRVLFLSQKLLFRIEDLKNEELFQSQPKYNLAPKSSGKVARKWMKSGRKVAEKWPESGWKVAEK